jgi:PAS domain S-box-containing protein
MEVVATLLALTFIGHVFALWRHEQTLSGALQASNRELALRVREAERIQDQLELALTSANVGLWDWNPRTDEVFFSNTVKTQLGYPCDAPWDHFDDWYLRLHPDDRDVAKRRVLDYFSDREEYKSTFRMRCADGSYRWMLSQGKAEFDANDSPTRMTGVLVDITERKDHEEELQKLNAELEHFASVASHDLKTPLRGIAGFARFLKEDYHGKLDDQADEYIQRIVDAVKRMQVLIDDLLEYTRIASKNSAFEVTSLEEVLEDAISLLDADVRDSQAEVTWDELPTLPADRAQLSRLFQNLLANAIKYCDGRPPRVHVAAEQHLDHWTVSLRDNGIGIRQEFHEKVFEIFRRLHNQRDYSGTGIGLAACRRIVTRHGGRIWVESKEGNGSTFYFTVGECSSEDSRSDQTSAGGQLVC